jgi:hypothetical protein
LLTTNRDLRVRVESRERLVEQQYARIACECPGERDPLAFATGELGRPRLGQMGDPETLQILVGPALARIGDVLAHVHVREERVLLEDEADPPLVGLAEEPFRRVEPGVRVEGDPARGGPYQARHGSENRGLSGSGGADEGNSALDVELELEHE